MADNERIRRGHLRTIKPTHIIDDEHFAKMLEGCRNLDDSNKFNVKNYESARGYARSLLIEDGIPATNARVSQLYKALLLPYTAKEAPIKVVMPHDTPDYIVGNLGHVLMRAHPGELDYTLLDIVDTEEPKNTAFVAVRDSVLIEGRHREDITQNVVRYDSTLDMEFQDRIKSDHRNFTVIVPQDVQDLLQYSLIHAGEDGYRNSNPIEKGDNVVFYKHQNRMHCTRMNVEHEPIEYLVEKAERVHPLDMKKAMRKRGVRIK